jgi:hypothetical protein
VRVRHGPVSSPPWACFRFAAVTWLHSGEGTRGRDPMRWIICSILHNPSRHWLLWFPRPLTPWPLVRERTIPTERPTQPLTRDKWKCFCGIECGWCLRLTALPPSVSRLPRQCGILNISQPYSLPRPVTGIALLTYPFRFTCLVILLFWVMSVCLVSIIVRNQCLTPCVESSSRGQ